jgi:L-amino acid N-acyltransferase YncA
MLRLMYEEDIPVILEIIKEFRDEGLEKGYPMTFDNNSLSDMARFFIRNGIAIVGIVKGKVVGFIVGSVERSVKNYNEIIGAERLWCVRPSCRNGIGIKLLNKFEEICKFKGANHILVGYIASVNSDAMEKLYAKRGYKLMEKHYVKRI